MLSFVQRLLEISMCLDNSNWAVIRLIGRVLGIFPVWYSERLEKRLFQEDDELSEKLRRRYSRKKETDTGRL